MITTIIKRISTPIKLTKIEKEAADAYTFKFAIPASIKWVPGSYAHFVCSDLQNGKKFQKELLRELSIMSHFDENYIGFTTRIRQQPSEFKNIVLNLKVGDEIRMFKIGNHFKKRKANKPVVFISMGVGIATFRPLILEYLRNAPQTLPIININIDRTGDFIYRNELDKLPADKIENIQVSNRADLFAEIDQCIGSENIYYVIGSKEFNKAIGEYLQKKNISEKDIVFDKK